jgi:hypothetical protein
MDLMMFVIIYCLNYIPIYCAYFGGSASGEAAKIGSSKKIKLLYLSINQRTDEYKELTDEYRGPMCQIRTPAPAPVYSSVTVQSVTFYRETLGKKYPECFYTNTRTPKTLGTNI